MSRAGADSLFDRRPRGSRVAAWWLSLLALALALVAMPARGAGAELATFDLERAEDGLYLSYTVEFELARAVEEALAKSVAIYFVVEAEVFRERWYWTDKRVSRAARVWRIVYQPLTANYRVTFGDLSQTFPSRAEALAAVRRALRWKIADASALEDGGRHYVEFGFRLDTSLLPRPMQIGIGGQADWSLNVERVQRLP